jgi:hypothetical protein
MQNLTSRIVVKLYFTRLFPSQVILYAYNNNYYYIMT